MHKLKLVLVGLVVGFVLSETPAFAQGMPNMGGGMAGPPRRKLKKNSTPALSPALNMVPGVSTSFEGQFLMRTVPQERADRFQQQVGRQTDNFQNQLNAQGAIIGRQDARLKDVEIRTGLAKANPAASFMNYRGYYQLRSGGGRQR